MRIVCNVGNITLDFGVSSNACGAPQAPGYILRLRGGELTLAPPRNVRQRRRCNCALECTTSNAQPVPCCDSSQVAPGACARAEWQVPPRGLKTACFNYQAIHTAATKAEMEGRLIVVKLRRAAARHLEATQEATKYVYTPVHCHEQA